MARAGRGDGAGRAVRGRGRRGYARGARPARRADARRRGGSRVAVRGVGAAAAAARWVGVNDRAAGDLARPGVLRPAGDAPAVARESLARELELSPPLLAGSADEIAATADIAAFAAP